MQRNPAFKEAEETVDHNVRQLLADLAKMTALETENIQLRKEVAVLLIELQDIREIVSKRQLPITNIVWKLADTAITKAEGRSTTKGF